MKMLCVTLADDLHAYIIRDKLQRNHGVQLSLIEVDRLMGLPEVVWSCDADYQSSELPVTDGCGVRLRETELVWWRRARADQADAVKYEDRGVADLVSQDWRSVIRGALETAFCGVWVSRPETTERASFKMMQLKAAKECGFRIPKTLISNRPVEVKSFCENLGGSFIVKPIAGSRHLLLTTKMASRKELPGDDIIAICPTIYQEYIRGCVHLRINQFGKKHFRFRIESPELDWRPQLPKTISYVKDADDDISRQCYTLLHKLGIAMGVFDIKLSDDGEPVFFEVNPQGQFLFLEGITRFPLADEFAEFLASEAMCGGCLKRDDH